MKRILSRLAVAFSAAVMLTSCYSYNTVVGSGAQGTQQVKKWNNYVIGGLVPVGVSDPKVMAAGAENYTVNTKHSFVNMLVGGLTFGIYAPTTTTVTK